MLPNVWVLLCNTPGDNGQLTSLADALGWPYETKQLVYNPLSRCPDLLLGASSLSLTRPQSTPLTPPWPDLVIGAARHSVPVARWIKKQSGGRTRLVYLMYAQAPLHWFDLIVTTPQYCLPSLPNVLHNTAPLNRIAPQRLAAAASQWEARLSDFPRPYTALLVGGNSSTYELDPITAADLSQKASAHVRATGGSLLISTNPRTPTAAAEALFATIDCVAYRYRWRPYDTDNPYQAYLALADDFIVTADSASQIVEAVLSNKPVYLFEWSTRPLLRFRLKGVLRRWLEHHKNQSHRQRTSKRSDGRVRLYNRLVYLGLFKPTRDFAAYLQALKTRGLVRRLGDAVDSTLPRPLDDMERTVLRIRSFFIDGS